MICAHNALQDQHLISFGNIVAARSTCWLARRRPRQAANTGCRQQDVAECWIAAHRAREASVGGREEADGQAACPRARGAADAVHVVLGRAGHVVVDHHLYVFDICAQVGTHSTARRGRAAQGCSRSGRKSGGVCAGSCSRDAA